MARHAVALPPSAPPAWAVAGREVLAAALVSTSRSAIPAVGEDERRDVLDRRSTALLTAA